MTLRVTLVSLLSFNYFQLEHTVTNENVVAVDTQEKEGFKLDENKVLHPCSLHKAPATKALRIGEYSRNLSGIFTR